MPPTTKPTICLIDDDEIYQFTTQTLLRARQLADGILPFSDGEIALDYLRQHKTDPEALPDLIFLDLSMPVMDGWDFLEEFSRLRPRLAKPLELYVISSSTSAGDIARVQACPDVSGYLVKPVDADRLEALIKA